VDLLLGREVEVRRLSSALETACQGQPQFVMVTGEAGIGKSRLLHEAAEMAHRRECLLFHGTAAEFEVDLPFGVIIDAFDDYLKALDEHAVDRLAMDRQGALAAVFPSLQSLDGSVDYPISAEERFRVHRAVAGLIERLAVRQPVVCILDDLHWADAASLELISHLVRRPARAGLLVLLGARLGQGSAPAIRLIEGLRFASDVENVHLGSLSLGSIAELVGSDGRVDIASLHRVSGGNPFYALQLARARDDADTPAYLFDDSVPPAVSRSIAAELDALSPSARAFAQAAAVVGDPFDLDLAISASGLIEGDALQHVDELAAHQLIRPSTTPRRFFFRHPLVRNAVYHAALPGARLSIHRRLVMSLTERSAKPALVANHIEHCAVHGDLVAINVLQRAGEDSAKQAPASAARWFSMALQLLPASVSRADRLALLTSLATAQCAIGAYADAHDALEQCLALGPAGDASDVDLTISCAEIERLLGHHTEAQSRLEAAFVDRLDPSSAGSVSLMIALSSNSLFVADNEAMLDWARRAVEVAAEIHDDALTAAALAAETSGAAFTGHVRHALDLRARVASMIDSLPDDRLARQLGALASLAAAELYLDLYREARVHAERGLTIARATGQSQLVPTLAPVFGSTLWILGDMNASAEVLDEAVESARLVGVAPTLAMNLYNRAIAAVMVGDLEIALRLSAESVELAREFDHGMISAFGGAAHAHALFESGDAATAREILLSSTGGEDIPAIGGGWRAIYLELLTRCCLDLGRLDEARSAAHRARSLADELEMHLPALAADRGEALVAMADGAHDRAIRLARSAISHSEALGAPIHVATSHELHGRALAAGGRREESIAELVGAADGYERLGATRYRDQVEQQLRQLGHTVHRRSARAAPESAGVASLSGRELEVAELLRARHTNREIAQELFLSMKTVESHVRHIFTKLGATSRIEVASIVDRDGARPTRP
jgi:DNA-binding CsgD family transcriptional regulator